MASGRERSMSIYTFLHLVFQRRQPVENGTKEKITEREEKDIPTLKSHMLVCLLCIHVCVYLVPKTASVHRLASPNPDTKGCGEF